MTPVSDSALEFLHTKATAFFTDALAECNIETAFDRRLRFEGNTLVRLLPDWTAGSVTTTILMPHRRGQLPSVRAVVEFLAERLAG